MNTQENAIEDHAFDLSVVVPTYQEAENLPHLFQRIESTLRGQAIRAEVIVVDDNSRDGTEFICRRYGDQLPIRLYVRTEGRGLSSAVVLGMRQSRGQVICVMDADLSHPPERIPELFNRLIHPTDGQVSADFVIGSRYTAGGSTADDWGLLRWLNSKIATLAARPFTSAADPMAGFFAMRHSGFLAAEHQLNPIGYKIGLELIVKTRRNRVVEVPIRFSNRVHGESKLTMREQFNYLKHLACLFRFKYPTLGKILFLPDSTGGSVITQDVLLPTFASDVFHVAVRRSDEAPHRRAA